MKRIKNLFALLLVCGMLLGLCSAAEAAAPKISHDCLALVVGAAQQLSVKNTGDKTVKWSSSNKKVATVTKEGEVTAKKAGTAKITAKVGDKKLKCSLTVLSDKPIISEKKLSLTVGEASTLEVFNAGDKKIKWSSSKKSVATVSSKGKVKAKKAGTAKITAKIGKKKLTCKVTVADEPDEAIAQAAYSKTIKPGQYASVSCGARTGWWPFYTYPKIKITNTGGRYNNIWIDGRLSRYQLPPGWSITRTYNPYTSHTVRVTDVFGSVDTYNIRATVSAVNNINRIS